MKRLLVALFACLLGIGLSAPLYAADIPTVNKDELKTMLGSPELVVIDVRTGRDWTSSEFKIKGAQRHEAGDVGTWAANYGKEQTIVLYCA
jgi:rhodanese-related sulfurtransferase